MKTDIAMNLVPVGELKPLAFFKFHDDAETMANPVTQGIET